MWLNIFDNGFWHVVPCDEEGEALPPHIPHPDCPCNPEIEFVQDGEEWDEEEEAHPLIIHNQLH